MTRRRWGLTHNRLMWLNALAWTFALGLLVASVLIDPSAPAVRL